MIDTELEKLIQDLVEGGIDPHDLVKLEAELISDPQSMSSYLAYQDLNNLLEVRAEICRQVSTPVVPVELILKRQKLKTFRTALLSAAALVLLTLIVLNLFFVKTNQGKGLTFESSPGTKFTLTHSANAEAPTGLAMVKGSRLQLSQGIVELSFARGVKSVIIAPADLTLNDSLYLKEGTAWFQVPKGEEGFIVRTRELDIVDLGTEFGVLAKADDNDEVHVLKGKVQVTARRALKESTTLTAGQASKLDLRGRLVRSTSEFSLFLTELPEEVISYRGALDLTEGTRSLGKGGVCYTVSSEGNVSSNYNEGNGDMVIYTEGRVSVIFSEAVDIQISAANLPFDQSSIWNSDEDFGSFSAIEGSLSRFQDPNKEILIEPLSGASFDWKFSKPNTSELRTPSQQTWSVELKGIREFVFSKDAASKGRAAFNFQVTSPCIQ